MVKGVFFQFLNTGDTNATDLNGDVGEIPALLIIPFPSEIYQSVRNKAGKHKSLIVLKFVE